MRLVQALLAGVVVTALVAAATAFAGSNEAAAQKQRIGIDEFFGPELARVGPDKPGPFRIWPYSDSGAIWPLSTPGEAIDKGKVSVLWRDSPGRTLRNGMMVGTSVVRQVLVGRRGTLRLTAPIDVYDIPSDGSRAHLGTWKITGGTRGYSGVKGGGRYVAVVTEKGMAVHMEGWVTR